MRHPHTRWTRAPRATFTYSDILLAVLLLAFLLLWGGWR